MKEIKFVYVVVSHDFVAARSNASTDDYEVLGTFTEEEDARSCVKNHDSKYDSVFYYKCELNTTNVEIIDYTPFDEYF